MACEECPTENPTVYIGESSRNLYTRSREHVKIYERKKRGSTKESFIFDHQEKVHGGAEAKFKARVTDTFSDCMSRQISEAVSIRRCEKTVLNSKSEWHQPALYQVQHEIQRG